MESATIAATTPATLIQIAPTKAAGGSTTASEITAYIARFIGLSRANENPTAAIVPSQMPNVTREKLRTISVQLPSISKLGVRTNRKGRMKVDQPTTQAIQPVVQPSVRAILAAA